jgi:hypothetical protein
MERIIGSFGHARNERTITLRQVLAWPIARSRRLRPEGTIRNGGAVTVTER